jgi:hypothetical protein
MQVGRVCPWPLSAGRANCATIRPARRLTIGAAMIV